MNISKKHALLTALAIVLSSGVAIHSSRAQDEPKEKARLKIKFDVAKGCTASATTTKFIDKTIYTVTVQVQDNKPFLDTFKNAILAYAGPSASTLTTFWRLHNFEKQVYGSSTGNGTITLYYDAQTAYPGGPPDGPGSGKIITMNCSDSTDVTIYEIPPSLTLYEVPSH
jgi:hypothetical protein